MSKNRSKKILEWILFLGYIALLVYFMFFAESLGRTEFRESVLPRLPIALW